MMTVESLLSSMRPYTAHFNAVKSAEQIFFGSKRLYTDIAPIASTSGQAEGKSKKADVKEAVSSAKKIAKDALKGKKGGADDSKIVEDVKLLRQEVNGLKTTVEELRALLVQLQIAKKAVKEGTPIPAAAAAVPAPEKAQEAANDDIDLFGSDDDEVDEEKEKLTQQRLAEYAAKKAKKPGPIAKSSVILDIKPWDDETDLEEMEKLVRSIEQDGLVWGGGKLIPLAYGIKKLQIICVIEDLKVSVDDLIEKITGDFENHVQSVDIAAFNKI